MRLHQSWYRAAVLGLEQGDGPDAAGQRPPGSMLTREDAARGSNFLDPAIFEVARRRMHAGAGVDPYRCLADLASDQAFCFNLFGLLVEDTGLATALLATVLDDVRRVVEVHISHRPSPRSEYLGDRSAFDAFVGYERDDGTRSCVGVAVALADGFGPATAEAPRYRELTRAADSPWRDDRYEQLASLEHNPLWRTHLLVEALRRHPAEPYVGGRFAVVYHPADSEARRLVAGYRDSLREPESTFADWRLDLLLDRWQSAGTGERARGWLERCRARYLALDGSADAWESASAGNGAQVVPQAAAPAEV